MSIELIYDGILFTENLTQISKNKAWLMEQPKAEGINDISEVFWLSSTPMEPYM